MLFRSPLLRPTCNLSSFITVRDPGSEDHAAENTVLFLFFVWFRSLLQVKDDRLKEERYY